MKHAKKHAKHEAKSDASRLCKLHALRSVSYQSYALTYKSYEAIVYDSEPTREIEVLLIKNTSSTIRFFDACC